MGEAIRVVGRSVVFRMVLVGLLCGASACTGASGGHGGASAGAASGGVAAEVAWPLGEEGATLSEVERRRILRLAEENGWAPAGGEATEVRYDSGYGPELIWRAKGTGAVCSGSSRSSGPCIPLADIAARPNPGVGTFIGAALHEGKWSVMLLSSGETVDRVMCQGRSFPARRAYEVTVDGVLHTVYTVSIPRGLQGEYRVAVRRDGQPAEDRVTLNMDRVAGPARC
ncbi:hypothetical protein [Kitasatospora sp. NPDC056800]|uniref:hypothetical protein n=1 Tax=Kitasatospora sp. NPDC056800 TaxID=3345948 RepID=UPI0036782B50